MPAVHSGASISSPRPPTSAPCTRLAASWQPAPGGRCVQTRGPAEAPLRYAIIPDMMNSAPAELSHQPAPAPAQPWSKRGGRRAGASRTRDAVLAAAQRQFSEMGYDRTTMRSVALEAAVDQKLVAYFFGSKQALFVAATRLPFDAVAAMPSVLAGDPAGMGERLARLILGMLEDPVAGSRLIG